MPEETKVIIVVDDNPTVAHLLRDALEGETYDVRTVRDGRRALEVITDSDPDLVILDVYLPGLSGFELFDRLKAAPETAAIPVLFISAAMPGPELARRGLVEYLPKPFGLDDLLSRVERLSARRHTAD